VLYVFSDKKNVANIIMHIIMKQKNINILYLFCFCHKEILLLFFKLSDLITTFGFVVFVKTETLASGWLECFFSVTTAETQIFWEAFLVVEVFFCFFVQLVVSVFIY